MEDEEYDVPFDENLQKLADELQKRIGILPRVECHRFSLSSAPGEFSDVLRVLPSSQTEIIRVVRAARSLKLCVRCRGSATSRDHSLFIDNHNVLVDLRDLCDAEKMQLVRIRRTDFTSVSGVRVLAGVTLMELCDFQVQNQVNLATSVEATSRTVVGSVVSGSPVTAREEGSSLADQVLEIRIIDCHGDVRTYIDNGDAENRMKLKSVVANLGLMGVVYDVTLKVTPIMNVNVEYEFATIDNIINDPSIVKRKVEDNYSTQLVYTPFNSGQLDSDEHLNVQEWFPGNDEVMMRTFNPADIGSESCERRYIQLLDPVMTLNFQDNPEEIPTSMKAVFDIQRRSFLKSHIQPLPWAIHCFEPISHPTNEFCFTVNTGNDFEQFAQVFKLISERIKVAALSNRYPINVAVRVNFTGPTTVGLCPGTGDQPGQVAHFRLIGLVDEDQTMTKWCGEVGQLILEQFPDCSPQWSALWVDFETVNVKFQNLFARAIEDFKKHLEDVDRDGMFMNAKLKCLLYPTLQDDYRKIYREERDVSLARVY